MTVAALLISGNTADAGEQKLVRSTPPVDPPAPIVAVVPAGSDVDDPQLSARRLSAALVDRLKPIEARLRKDTNLRQAGAVIGVGAVALGALRGEHRLTIVGMGALRLGLHSQLSTIERTSGFSVSPRVERRGFSVFLTRTFQ